ncbi:MAG: hypothetical protein SNJ71_04140, partial [Bacteroidales bacterium]
KIDLFISSIELHFSSIRLTSFSYQNILNPFKIKKPCINYRVYLLLLTYVTSIGFKPITF